jgi:hypothetical protein
MEPHIIDYYNEFPQMVHIIDDMNQELTDVQQKYETLEETYNELKQKYEPEGDFTRFIQKAYSGTHYDIARVFFYQYKNQYKFSNYKKKQWYEYNKEEKEWYLLDSDINVRLNLSTYLIRLYELNIEKCTKIIEAPINISDDNDEIKRIMAEDKIRWSLNIIEKIKSQTFKNSVMKECRELFYQCT